LFEVVPEDRLGLDGQLLHIGCLAEQNLLLAERESLDVGDDGEPQPGHAEVPPVPFREITELRCLLRARSLRQGHTVPGTKQSENRPMPSKQSLSEVDE
jgi:hypothetical protein